MRVRCETREEYFARVEAALCWQRTLNNPDRQRDDELAAFMSIFHPDHDDLTEKMLRERRSARR